MPPAHPKPNQLTPQRCLSIEVRPSRHIHQRKQNIPKLRLKTVTGIRISWICEKRIPLDHQLPKLFTALVPQIGSIRPFKPKLNRPLADFRCNSERWKRLRRRATGLSRAARQRAGRLALAALIVGSLAACAVDPYTYPQPAPVVTAPADDGPLPPALQRGKSRWTPVRWSELPGWGQDSLHEVWNAWVRGCERPAPGQAQTAFADPASRTVTTAPTHAELGSF